MSLMQVDHCHAQQALAEAVQQSTATTESLDDLELLAPSRCHGWAVVDVVTYVRTGLLEMLGGVIALTEAPADQDAASYRGEYHGEDDAVDAILWTRRTSSTYRRPTGAVADLRMAADAVHGAVDRMD